MWTSQSMKHKPESGRLHLRWTPILKKTGKLSRKRLARAAAQGRVLPKLYQLRLKVQLIALE